MKVNNRIGTLYWRYIIMSLQQQENQAWFIVGSYINRKYISLMLSFNRPNIIGMPSKAMG